MSTLFTRRSLLTGVGASAAGLLCGCDSLAGHPSVREALFSAENFHRWAQRTLSDRDTLAREFRPDQISPVFRANGTHNPNTEEYKDWWRQDFANWRLRVDGLVARPLLLSLAQLRAMPAREQITRHDCVEGWSAVGKWQGTRLSAVLNAVQPTAAARYVVFHCADPMEDDGQSPYYESIDMDDAYHEQTILAYMLNDKPLPVANGAPIRLRVERQLGYKHAKYVMRLEVVDSFAHIGEGKGGYWEDQGYQWYAGI